MRADFVSLAVRTGDAGMGGVSLLLVELDREGVSRTPLEKMGWHSSDTATIHFDDVEVPAENLIGPENAGFGAIMRNFNGERLGMAQQATAYSRLCYEDALDWARERETFGRPLITRQSIRHKLARMLQMIGATQAMIDHAAWTVKNGCPFPGDFALLDHGRGQFRTRRTGRAYLSRGSRDGDRRRLRRDHVRSRRPSVRFLTPEPPVP